MSRILKNANNNRFKASLPLPQPIFERIIHHRNKFKIQNRPYFLTSSRSRSLKLFCLAFYFVNYVVSTLSCFSAHPSIHPLLCHPRTKTFLLLFSKKVLSSFSSISCLARPCSASSLACNSVLLSNLSVWLLRTIQVVPLEDRVGLNFSLAASY
jgi:hypothetical protein